ncbi:MAG TPA: M23 family metallopeptidase [Kofleriaceae bacterium]|nr:M23 family metallopeptidase [Kofleriaceae bacterium]
MRSAPVRSVVGLALLAGLVTGTGTGRASQASADALGESLTARRASVDKTLGLLDATWSERSTEVEQRVRALYKLARAGQAGLWLDPAQRTTRVHWRAAARRILRRDLRELDLLREELAVAHRAKALFQQLEPSAAGPAQRSLRRPVPGSITSTFGTYRHAASRATLSRRGVEMRAERGDRVHAVEAGTVRFAGTLRGLDQAVLIDHGGYTSVTARLGRVQVAVGASVGPGQVVGQAAGHRVYLEIRLDLGPGGEPIDPAPLLARP